MTKAKGHRANKPNDSFGTINNDNLYRGSYKEDVYKEDEDTEVSEQEEQTDPSQEATQEENFANEPESQQNEVDYKKRYDDLKRHYDEKVNEYKSEIEEMKAGKTQQYTNEELEQIKQQNPDLYNMIEKVSSARVQTLQEELEQLKSKEKELVKQKAYEELLRLQPDFDTLKADEKFLEWLQEQPKSISDGIYRNNTDAKWASRVVDLYKADTGSKPQKKSKNADAAASVTKPQAKEVQTRADGNKRTWKASEIRKMKPWEFEKLEEELDNARSEGRIDFSS